MMNSKNKTKSNEIIIIGKHLFLPKRKHYLKLLNKLLQILKFKNSVAITLHFIHSQKMQELNKSYCNKDKKTDVLSFPIDSNFSINETQLLGDIFISPSNIKDNYLNYGHSKKREFSYLFLHSVLHLLGYKHENKRQEKTMHLLCEKVLNFFNIKRYN